MTETDQQPVERDLREGVASYEGLALRSRQKRAILHALIESPGAFLPARLLCDRLDLVSTGTTHGGNHLSVVLFRLRRSLKPLGVIIENAHGAGYFIPPAGHKTLAMLKRAA